jgi:hypothetical protein
MALFHTYTRRMNAEGGYTLTQLGANGVTKSRPSDYLDFVIALGEPGTPRVTTIAYTPPSIEGLKSRRRDEVLARTQELFNSGTVATAGGVDHTFDVGGGSRSLASWLGYNQAASDILSGYIPVEMMPPAYTKSGETLQLTAGEGKALYGALLEAYMAITSAEIQLLKDIDEAVDAEALALVVDNR